MNHECDCVHVHVPNTRIKMHTQFIYACICAFVVCVRLEDARLFERSLFMPFLSINEHMQWVAMFVLQGIYIFGQ